MQVASLRSKVKSSQVNIREDWKKFAKVYEGDILIFGGSC
jgi:hypothetical protein